jgi:trimeric autotransporter adhesin
MRTKLFFLSFLYSIQLVAQIPTTSLDSEYKFTSGSLDDTFGAAANLTRTGSAATTINDRFGTTTNALNLAGDYFKRSALFSNDLSVSFWVKTSTNNAIKQTIIDQTTRTSNTEDNTKVGWYTYLQNGKIGLAANFGWRYTHNSISYTGNSDYTNTIATTTIADNNWHHVVVTMQKTSNYPSPGSLRMTYLYKIYIDNVLEASNGDSHQAVSGAGGHAWNLLSTLTSVTIANDHLNNLTNRYSGGIDDIRFYTNTLNATDVTSLYNESNTLSRNDFNEFSLFTVYPNPASDLITVKSNERIESYELLSIEGGRIKIDYDSSIDISDLSSGIYVLKVKTEEGKFGTKKIIKN